MTQTRRTDSMAPGFLIASPRLDGGPFERAVILLVHHDADGSMGYIVNKPVEIDFGSLLLSVNPDLEPLMVERSYQRDVYFGGPVRIEQLWLLFHRRGAEDLPFLPERDAFSEVAMEDVANFRFHDQWLLSASGEVIEGFATHANEGVFLPMLGYSGWDGGQLEAEIEEGSWLALDFAEDLLTDTPPARCWDVALERLGVDPTAFMMMSKMGSA